MNEKTTQALRDLRDKLLYEGYPNVSLGPDNYFDADEEMDYIEVNQAMKDAFEEGISFALDWAANNLTAIIADAELEK